MARITRDGDLEINEDHEFQRLCWRVQRVAWVVMAAILLAALLGLFGPGLLGRATVGDAGASLRLEFQRFGRLGSPTTLLARLRPGRRGEARVWLSREYLESVSIERAEPAPVRVEAGPDGMTYVFLVAPGGPTSVAFRLEAERPGPASARVRLDDGPTLAFVQFFYP